MPNATPQSSCKARIDISDSYLRRNANAMRRREGRHVQAYHCPDRHWVVLRHIRLTQKHAIIQPLSASHCRTATARRTCPACGHAKHVRARLTSTSGGRRRTIGRA